MTHDLRKVIEDAERVLSPEEQDGLARWLQAEIDSERRWQVAFLDPRSPRLLERLAAKALEESRTGIAKDLDPDDL